MGKQRDPKRDEAFEIYKASGGDINLNVIAAQLGVGDGTLRGWKAKDSWEKILADSIESEVPPEITITLEEPTAANEYLTDDLYEEAIKIVIEAKQASVSLLQRRLRIGYTRAARMIDWMERNGIVSAYEGSKPRTILIDKDHNLKPVKPPKPPKSVSKERNEVKGTERNAPINGTERNKVMERSDKVDREVEYVNDIEEDNSESDGLTPRQNLFVRYYLINFNATQAAIKAGYSFKAAKETGYKLLTYIHVKAAVKKHAEELTSEIGVNFHRVANEYMKIAFSDIAEFMEFGQMDQVMMTDAGPMLDPVSGEVMTYKRNFVLFKSSDEVDGTIISEVKQGKDGVSLKLHDKMKALEWVTKYFDMLPDHHKRKIEDERLKIDRERLELDKIKAAGNGDLDEELIDDWVGGVLGDEEPDDSREEGTE